MPRDCPLCGLCNLDTAARCDCGYDFHGGPQGLRAANRVGVVNMTLGALVCVLVSMVLAVAFQLQPSQDVALAFWVDLIPGVLLFSLGVLLFSKGVVQYRKTRHY